MAHRRFHPGRLVLLLLLALLPLTQARGAKERTDIDRLQELAESGNPKAQNDLATFYFIRSMSGTNEDFALAVYWFEKAALKNEPHALFNLGICYERGLGVEKDMKKALDYYRQAADLGLEKAQLNCALTFQEMQGMAEAARYFEMAAKQGNAVCQREIGRMYLVGEGVEQNVERGMGYLHKAGENGDVEALLLLADSYGGQYEGVTPSLARMMDYLWEAASQNSPRAMSRIAYCYEEGIGQPQDTSLAVKWYEKAASLSYPDAMVNLGHCYAVGRGVAQDLEQAFEWYSQAAKLQSPLGWYNVAVCYALGDGVGANQRLAHDYFLRAAQAGLRQAQYNLGILYEDGRGVPASPQQAVHWYRRAVDQGDHRAMVALAHCYYDGIGTPVNRQQAKELFAQAAEAQNEDAITALSTLFPEETQ